VVDRPYYLDRENCFQIVWGGPACAGLLVPLPRWRTEVRRRLKSAPQEPFHAVKGGRKGAISGLPARWLRQWPGRK
jgi:hypothetical protein